MGFTTALHPMSDMATEPRWARNFGTFGSNAALSAEMTVAYMKGFQGEGLSDQSVMTMVKHFPGGGPQLDGLDPHLKSGESQVYPGNNFDYHLAPFIAAIENDMRVVMPYYGIPTGQTDEDVAMAFNRYILTDLLRDELGFEGVICTDWGVITGRIWGVEPLTVEERYLKSIEAGVDQYGGESEPEYIVDLVNQGVISEARIDESVRRILKNKFDLGLFESPFVDETAVEDAVNLPQYVSLGMTAQRNAVVLLDNSSSALPLAAETRIFVDGLAPSVAANYGTVVDTPEQADVVLLFLNTVFNGNQPAGTDSTFDQMMATRFPDTNLAFSDEILAKAASYSDVSQLVTLVDLNRPAVLTELKGMSGALVGTFGVSDEAMLDTVFGRHNPVGKLPFELPSSMAEVEAQLEDVPDDTANPLFPYGWGLRYEE
jgi:beta-glucosidase